MENKIIDNFKWNKVFFVVANIYSLKNKLKTSILIEEKPSFLGISIPFALETFDLYMRTKNHLRFVLIDLLPFDPNSINL